MENTPGLPRVAGGYSPEDYGQLFRELFDQVAVDLPDHRFRIEGGDLILRHKDDYFGENWVYIW